MKMTVETQLYHCFATQPYSDIYMYHLIHVDIDMHSHIYMCETYISVCTLVYPSLLFSTRINGLKPKKKIFGIQVPLISKTSAHL